MKQFHPVVLTIAGSDSGAGAGIQADLKTFTAMGCFGTTAITCITAQNPLGVSAVEPVKPGVVVLQIRAVMEAFPVAAAKTGMLYSAPIIKAVAAAVVRCGIPLLVVDPVMVATSGARLLKPDAMKALCDLLMPLARVITPNVPEAEALSGKRIRTLADLADTARLLANRFGTACVVKGGHLPRALPGQVAEVLYDGGKTTVFTAPRIKTTETHGSGCTFSAAIAAQLALGTPLPDAIEQARDFVAAAMRNPLRAGQHHPLNLSWQLGPPKGRVS